MITSQPLELTAEEILSIDNSGASSKHRRYRATNDVYRKSEVERGRDRDFSPYNEEKKEANRSRPFIMWDTEGTNHNATPFLFGSSRGDEIAHPAITTWEMFDLVLAREELEPDAIHFIYGGEYDFNMMLRNVDVKTLFTLKKFGKARWDGYIIGHIPRKWFDIKSEETGVTARIFDVVSFFGTSYVNALIEHKIGTEAQLDMVKEGKAGRSDFSFTQLDFIRPYWLTELELGPPLMDHMRDAFYRAGVYIHYWHGPGALARYALKQNNIKQAMDRDLPEPVSEASRYAFCGGRFEPFKAGLFDGTIYNADINSAYPYAATFLPDLSKGRWEWVSGADIQGINPTQFAVYHIEYQKLNHQRAGLVLEPQPLFRRFPDDRVQWSNSVTGWYWSPEAANVFGNPLARFIEAWVFIDDGSRPFAWIAEAYERRRKLKAMCQCGMCTDTKRYCSGDPMQITFKLMINAAYGQLAMRAGWERHKGPPTYHQLEWAGFITSMCRAMIYRAALGAWNNDSLISIDTDGIYTTKPVDVDTLTNGAGMGLGQWEMDTAPGILFWQSGVYFMPDEDGKWSMKKARGAPKGQISYDAAAQAMETFGDIHYKRNELIGYRWGLRNGMDAWRYFVTKDRSISFGGSPFSKRQHILRGCRTCRGFAGTDGMHDLSPASNGMTHSNHSKMHVLPWAKLNDHEQPRELIDLKSDSLIDEIWSEEP